MSRPAPHMALLESQNRKVLLSRLCHFLTLQRPKWCSGEGGGRILSDSDAGEIQSSKWRKLDSRSLGLSARMVSSSSWKVLRSLQSAGYEAYLVGGCVRDLLLRRVPKDFDIVTTAGLKQVKSLFRRSMIIGKIFPICRVSCKGSFVEVSSFETISQKCTEEKVSFSQMPKGCDPRDIALWKNCMKRDFTVNSLYFDPSRSILFDYTEALKDIRSQKLRTVKPAKLSFKEDEARILRGLRIAARLNLLISKEADAAIYSLSSMVANLSKDRIIMEMSYMFSYGAAEPSILLLEKYKILKILLPFHAAYFSHQEKNQISLRSAMLTQLFFNMDQLVSCEHPGDDSLWVAILAFHKALFSKPQHPVVVLTFASLLYHGTWVESLEFALKNAVTAKMYAPEILDDFGSPSIDRIVKEVTRLADQVVESVNFLVSKDHLSRAMARFPDSPCSDLVFVTRKTKQRVEDIFRILSEDITSLKSERRHMEIRSKSVTAGDVREIRFVMGKIILSTLSCDTAVSSGNAKKTQNAEVKSDARGERDDKPSASHGEVSRERCSEVTLPLYTTGIFNRNKRSNKRKASDRKYETEHNKPKLSDMFRNGK